MKLAILQPCLIPDLYYMASVLKSDLIYLQDSPTYSRKGRAHRFRVRNKEQRQWLRVPVRTGDKDLPLKDVRIDHSTDWLNHIAKALQTNYANSIYYDFYEPEILADLAEGEQMETLFEFITYFNQQLSFYLEFSWPRIELSSDHPNLSEDPDAISSHFEADIFYQEHEGRHFQRQSEMQEEALSAHPEYRQHFPDFLPGCSLLDLLFECGPESFQVLERLKD